MRIKVKTKNKADKQFVELLKVSKTDPNIIGLFFTGSRGKGMVTKYSDYDITMIVKDGVLKEYKKKYKGYGYADFDLSLITLKELENYAAWGSPSAWDRYNFVRLKPIVDKTGKLQTIISKKGILPPDKKKEFIAGALDHYINQVYRFVKNLRDGRTEAAHLEAAESIPPLLEAVFALENRIKPFHKYLDWELSKFPLIKLPWPKKVFIGNLIKILKTADLKIQQETLKGIEKVFRKEGFGKVFDGWEGKYKWAINYKIK